MRAVTLGNFGDPVTFSDVPTPEPAAGEARVRVKAAGLNRFDTAVASGAVKEMMDYTFPVVLGRDFAGTVDTLGEDTADVQVGDEVFGYVPPGASLHDGALAQYVVLPAEMLVHRPPALDVVAAAALPLAVTAALMSVEAVDPQPGDTVLIVGATGGVGSYAIQLIAARGATVLATGLPEDDERLRRLGATTVIDYRGTVADAVRAANADGIQGLIDLLNYPGAEHAELTRLVRDGGGVASTLNAADAESLVARNITATNIIAAPDPAVLARFADQAASGALQIDVEEVFPFEEATKGLEILANGEARGKLVVTLSA